MAALHIQLISISLSLSLLPFRLSAESRFHRLDYVHLLLRQERQVMEGFGLEHHHHRRGLLHLRPNAYNNSSVFEESSNAKEQCLLSHHHEPARDALPRQSSLYRGRPVEQECRQMRDHCANSALLESHDERLVLRVHLHHLRPNHQRIVAAEDAVHTALCICGASDLCSGECVCDDLCNNDMWK